MFFASFSLFWSHYLTVLSDNFKFSQIFAEIIEYEIKSMVFATPCRQLEGVKFEKFQQSESHAIL